MFGRGGLYQNPGSNLKEIRGSPESAGLTTRRASARPDSRALSQHVPDKTLQALKVVPAANHVQIIVVSPLDKVERLGVTGGVEDLSPKREWDDLIAITVDDESRHGDLLQRTCQIILSAQQPVHRESPVVRSRYRFDRGEGRLQDEAGCRSLTGQDSSDGSSK